MEVALFRILLTFCFFCNARFICRALSTFMKKKRAAMLNPLSSRPEQSSGLRCDGMTEEEADEVPEVDDGDWIARIDDEGNNDVMRRLLAFYAEHPQLVDGKEAPEQLCSNCYDSLKKCEVPNRSVLNQFVAEKWPHLPELNFIERLLIQVSFTLVLS